MHGPLALVAEDVERGAALRARLGAAPVLALVEEEPGLLPVEEVRLEEEAADADRDVLGHLAPPDLPALLEPLERAERRVGHEHRARGREHALERGAQLREPLLHAEREHLGRQAVPVAVHDEPGELVGFAVDEANRRLAGVDRVAQALGALEPLDEERGVDLVPTAGQ